MLIRSQQSYPHRRRAFKSKCRNRPSHMSRHTTRSREKENKQCPIYIVIVRYHYLGWWTTTQILTPTRASRRSALRSSWEDELSKPEVGSSKIRSDGSITNSRPTFTRFLWPPDIPRFSTVPTKESRTACNPNSSMTLSTMRTLSAFGKFADNLP